MNIADLVHKRPCLRRVGIRFDDRIPVVMHAKKIYVELGVACDLDEDDISILVPRIAAQWHLGLLEYATGRPGFNEWEGTQGPG